jgi:acetyl esterase/lipase
VPMMDGQRAIRTVRARAEEWNVDPARIGVMGFSAGGHLASTLGTHFDNGNPDADDPIERASSRPDFMILCYAVITMELPYTHRGSRQNLLGGDPDEALVRSLSNELQVTRDTPPTFLFHTDADTGVPAENSVQFYLALRRAGVPAELHIYRTGGHGVGLAEDIPGTKTWPDRCRDWLRGQGLLKHDNPAASK